MNTVCSAWLGSDSQRKGETGTHGESSPLGGIARIRIGALDDRVSVTHSTSLAKTHIHALKPRAQARTCTGHLDFWSSQTESEHAGNVNSHVGWAPFYQYSVSSGKVGGGW